MPYIDFAAATMFIEAALAGKESLTQKFVVEIPFLLTKFMRVLVEPKGDRLI